MAILAVSHFLIVTCEKDKKKVCTIIKEVTTSTQGLRNMDWSECQTDRQWRRRGRPWRRADCRGRGIAAVLLAARGKPCPETETETDP
jgi:hypothetical protein